MHVLNWQFWRHVRIPVKINLVAAFVAAAMTPFAVVAFQKPSTKAASSPKLGDSKVNAKDGLTYLWIPPGSYTAGCSPNDKQCFGTNRRPAKRH